MDRLFLDANILFSAAYKSDSRLRELWSLTDVELLSSYYAVEEAKRNITLARPQCLSDLNALISDLTLAVGLDIAARIDEIDLDEKDRPILSAAINIGATHLLTGDKLHFGHLFGTSIAGVVITRPAEYLNCRK